MPEKVGFIGLGIMGMPMARNLLKAGFEVVAYNRTASKTEALAREGARRANSPRELATECPVVITIVSDTPDVASKSMAAVEQPPDEGKKEGPYHLDGEFAQSTN